MIKKKNHLLPHSRVLPGDGWFWYLMHKLTGSLFDKNKDYCLFLTALREGHFTDIQLSSSDVHTCRVYGTVSCINGMQVPPS